MSETEKQTEDRRRHLFAEKASRYDMRCVYCDLPARHPDAKADCPKAPKDSEIEYR